MSSAWSFAIWPDGLRQLHLERPRIDLGEQVAGLDDLPFLERDAHQLAVDARLDDDDVARRHGAERVEVDVDAALARGRRDDGQRARRRVAAAAAAARRAGAAAGASAARLDQYQ